MKMSFCRQYRAGTVLILTGWHMIGFIIFYKILNWEFTATNTIGWSPKYELHSMGKSPYLGGHANQETHWPAGNVSFHDVQFSMTLNS